MKSRTKRIIAVTAAVVLLLVAVFAIYVNDYYRADETAAAALATDSIVTTQYPAEGVIAFCPENPQQGIIFYPGGKVEYTAYAPLLEALAQQGILTVVTEMPFNLAVLDINAAEGIKEYFPKVESWYMAGHSLGGSMAASYIADKGEEYKGLILFASYSTADLTQTQLKVLSVYGSEDKVLDMEKYAQYYSNLPADTEEYVIEDGCHAYFGSYGQQKGDGIASITPQQQTEMAVQAVVKWIHQ